MLLTGAAVVLGATPTHAQTFPINKLDLWDNSTGPHLRGAVIAQRRVYADIDGPEFLGSGAVGTPVSDAALQALSQSGANLVVLSHPGTFTEQAPHNPDPEIEAHLDNMIDRCAQAGLFVVIGLRTGPGRSEFTFHKDAAGSWFDEAMIDDSVWSSRSAQAGWVQMWESLAERYRDRANIAGYLLMVEPNANQSAPDGQGGILDEWDPEQLARFTDGRLSDWPSLSRRLARAIRSVDLKTPILVSPDGYAHRRFANLLDLNEVPGMVLAVHNYAPRSYTHQARGADIDFIDQDAEFEPMNATRWMVGEFGSARWAPRASEYLRQQVSSFEMSGAGWAIFRWDSGWRVYENQENMFNPLYGPRPDEARLPQSAPMLDTLQNLWATNRIRT
jgi:hypothetical protein